MLQFYYGDINLARDKFLQEQIKLDDGCILLSCKSVCWDTVWHLKCANVVLLVSCVWLYPM